MGDSDTHKQCQLQCASGLRVLMNEILQLLP